MQDTDPRRRSPTTAVKSFAAIERMGISPNLTKGLTDTEMRPWHWGDFAATLQREGFAKAPKKYRARNSNSNPGNVIPAGAQHGFVDRQVMLWRPLRLLFSPDNCRQIEECGNEATQVGFQLDVLITCLVLAA